MAGTTQYFGISYPQSTDLVKDGASNMQTIATGFDSAIAIPTYNNQVGTTYTFALTDIGKTVTASNAAAQTYTIPPQASVTWVAGTTLYVINLGAGVVTFAAGAGVTVTNAAQTLAQYQSARLVRTASNAWTVTPDSGGASGLTLVSATTIGTAVSSVTVSGAFSATFDAYKIIIGGSGTCSTNANLSLQLGASTTQYYSSGLLSSYAGSSPFLGVNNGASFTFSGMARTTNYVALDVDLLGAGSATFTQYRGGFNNFNEATVQVGLHQVATAFTSFTITPSAGTLTGGTIRVYGYQNS